jgi:hypothetical protein
MGVGGGSLYSMSRSPKHKLTTEEEQDLEEEPREVYLEGGRTLVVSKEGEAQLVEIRSESGMVEVRIALTERGPVLQMQSVRLAIQASEAVEIDSPKVSIRGDRVEVTGGTVTLEAEDEVSVEADGEVRVVGKMIYLN